MSDLGSLSLTTDPHGTRDSWRTWYAQPTGQILLDYECAALQEVLPDLFGYHVVQIGQVHTADLLAASRINHRVIVDVAAVPSASATAIQSYADDLPLATDGVDVVVLPHTLEFEADPHQILREVERVLIPQGHVVILGFNPLSLFGLCKLWRRREGVAPWNVSFLSVLRMRDWLALMGFEIVTERHYFYRPPLRAQALMRRLEFIERVGRWAPRRVDFGGAYLLVGKKRVATMTPLKPRWRSHRELLGKMAPAAGPTSQRARGG